MLTLFKLLWNHTRFGLVIQDLFTIRSRRGGSLEKVIVQSLWLCTALAPIVFERAASLISPEQLLLKKMIFL
jgi:hypothetical protein